VDVVIRKTVFAWSVSWSGSFGACEETAPNPCEYWVTSSSRAPEGEVLHPTRTIGTTFPNNTLPRAVSCRPGKPSWVHRPAGPERSNSSTKLKKGVLPMQKYDAIVIGSGQAGNPLSQKLADRGWTVALIERDQLGGTCINTG